MQDACLSRLGACLEVWNLPFGFWEICKFPRLLHVLIHSLSDKRAGE